MWCNDMNGKLLDTELAKDVAGSEDLLKRHSELLQDIQSHQEKWVSRNSIQLTKGILWNGKFYYQDVIKITITWAKDEVNGHNTHQQ